MTTKFDLPQGTLDLLVLKVLTAGHLHGYAIARRIQQGSQNVIQVPAGSLYPALRRLEARGLLISEWKESKTGHKARFYRLTRQGDVQLEKEASNWDRLTEAVGLILRMSRSESSSTNEN